MQMKIDDEIKLHQIKNCIDEVRSNWMNLMNNFFLIDEFLFVDEKLFYG